MTENESTELVSATISVRFDAVDLAAVTALFQDLRELKLVVASGQTSLSLNETRRPRAVRLIPRPRA